METLTKPRFGDIFADGLMFDGNGAYAASPYLAITGRSSENREVPVSLTVQDLHEKLELEPDQIPLMVKFVVLSMLLNYPDPEADGDKCSVNAWTMAHEAVVRYCVFDHELVIQVTAVARAWLKHYRNGAHNIEHLSKLEEMLK